MGRRASVVVLACLVAGWFESVCAGGVLPLTIRSPAVIRTACAQVASHARQAGAHWRIVCPTRIPYGQDWLCTPSGDLSVKRYSAGFSINCEAVSSAAPGTVHWVLAGGSPKILNTALLHPTDAIGRPETEVTEISPIDLHHQTVARYLIAPTGMAMYSDHVVLVWTDKGEMFQVSVHRWPNTRIASEQATAVAANIIVRGA